MVPEAFKVLVAQASNDELVSMLRELTLLPNDNYFVKAVLEEVKRRKQWS